MPEASGRGHGISEEGGKAVGRRVRLPRGARSPIKVFINGSEQIEGTDYEIASGMVIFREPIMKEDLSQLGPVRKLVLGLGLVGNYQKNEIVDVEYEISGKTQLASDLPVEPDPS
jgi:hypothetical protein